ncbi:MAG: TonB-dependent receptor [Desulfobulbaceae bacterium]|nr:TonB-dependent receptor [Desulfobulbaceae bacterium]
MGTSAEGSIDTLLTMSLEELVEITLPTRNPMPINKAPAIATVVTDKEIRNMGAQNLMDVLKMIPGLTISRNEQGFFMFDIRGISTVSSEKILLMIDGHSLNKNYVGSGLKFFGDYLSVSDIKRVEVVRGPGSALYGTNAFVAAINVVTKKSRDVDGLQLDVSGGNFSTRKVDLLGGKDFDNGLQVFSSFNYWKTNGPEVLIEQDRFTGTPWATTPGDADTAYDALEFLLKLNYGDLSYEGQYIQNDRGAYIGFANSLTDNNSIEYVNFWHELQYRYAFNPSFSSSLKLYWDHFEQDASVTLMPPGFLGTFPEGMIGGPKVKDRVLGTEVQFDYNLHDNNHLLVGFLYEHMKQYDVRSISNFDPTTSPPAYLGAVADRSAWANWNINTSRELYAVYLQDEWRVADTLNLTGGVRYDHYSDFGGTVSPRAALVWNFVEHAELKLLYGEAFRAPSFSELYNANNTSLLGSPDLKPEEIRTYEAAIGYRFFKHLRFDVNYFYNDIDKIIVRDNSTSPARYNNLGGAEIDGVELAMSGNYSADNYWRLSYAYKNPQDADTGDRIPFVASNQASLSLNYPLSEYLVSHMDILWIGQRPRPAGDPRDDLESYTTVDLSLTLRNIVKDFEIRGVVHNLLDEDYRDPDLSGASQYIPGDYPRAGISAMLTLSYRL